MAETPKVSTATPTPQAEKRTPLDKMSREERKQRYAQYQKKLGRSKLEVHGDPNIHYFWADKNDDGELVRLDFLEYFIVKEPKAKEVLAGTATPKVRAAGLREDGTYIIGDVILMGCPMEIYEFHMMDVEERSEAQIAASVEQFKSSAQQRGIPTFDVPVGAGR